MSPRTFDTDPDIRLPMEEVLLLLDAAGSQSARLIHDGVGQSLTGVSLLGQALASDLEGDPGREAEAVMCRTVVEQLTGSARQIRALARVCNPGEIRATTLIGAFGDLIRAFPPHRPIRLEIAENANPAYLNDRQAFHLCRFCIDALLWISQAGHPLETSLHVRSLPDRLILRLDGKATSAVLAATGDSDLVWRVLVARARLGGACLQVEADPGGALSCVLTVRSPDSTNEPGTP